MSSLGASLFHTTPYSLSTTADTLAIERDRAVTNTLLPQGLSIVLRVLLTGGQSRCWAVAVPPASLFLAGRIGSGTLRVSESSVWCGGWALSSLLGNLVSTLLAGSSHGLVYISLPRALPSWEVMRNLGCAVCLGTVFQASSARVVDSWGLGCRTGLLPHSMVLAVGLLYPRGHGMIGSRSRRGSRCSHLPGEPGSLWPSLI